MVLLCVLGGPALTAKKLKVSRKPQALISLLPLTTPFCQGLGQLALCAHVELRFHNALCWCRHPAQPASPVSEGTSSAAYYNLSPGKAELLNKMKELPGAAVEEEEPDHDLAQKKVRGLAHVQRASEGISSCSPSRPGGRSCH